MLRNLLYLAAGAIILAGCVSVQETGHTTTAPPCGKKPVQVLRHVVLLKFKDGTTSEQIRKIENTFCALPSKIDEIYGFEWGTDVSVENRSQGYTHCFVLAFRSEADRDKYLPHPAHKELTTMAGPNLDKILVVDYWTK
jgi:hypothetical protein